MAKPNSVSRLESKVNWLKGEKATPDQVIKINLEEGESLLTALRRCQKEKRKLELANISYQKEAERLERWATRVKKELDQARQRNYELVDRVNALEDKERQYIDTLQAYHIELLKCQES